MGKRGKDMYSCKSERESGAAQTQIPKFGARGREWREFMRRISEFHLGMATASSAIGPKAGFE